MTAVPVAVPGVLEHRSAGVAGHLPTVMLVHDFEDRLAEPAFICFVVDVDRHIDDLGAATLQQLLMAGRVELIAGEAGGIPDDEIVDVVGLAKLDGVLKRRPVCGAPGNTVVAEYLHDDRPHFKGLFLGLLDLAVDRNALVGLARRADAGVDNRGLILLHVLILFVIDDAFYVFRFEFFT
nr:hypothetical protein [Pseudogulbenkiania sp. MAI-1]